MAGVNYEVNIQLNAKTLDKQLGDLEKRVNNLKKNLAAPLRSEERAAKQAAASAKERARLEDRAAAAQVTRVNLGQRLNRLEEKGLDVTKGRTIINRSLKAYEEGRIQTARAQNSLARTYITQLERQLKVGVKTGRMQAENIDALSKAQVKRYTLDQQIRRLEEDGVKTDKLRAKLGEATTAQARRQFGSFKQLTGELSLAIRKERDKLALQKRQTRELERQRKLGMGTGATSPLGGTPQMVGSPAYKTRQLNLNANWTKFLGDLNDTAQIIKATRANNARVNQFKQAQINRNWGVFLEQLNDTARVIQKSAQTGRKKRRNERLQGVALGAGFPLLFGGGPGAILGGAAGGLVGGPAGFAAQIALSAIGQQFDKVAAAAFETGKALTSTGGTLEFMREKSLFSTEAIEDRAIALEEAGEVEKLAALTASDLAKTIGTDGVKALQDLGKQTNETTKQWNTLTTQLFALISGPLAEFLKIVNSVLGGITTEQKLGALKRNVSPEDLQRIEQIEREVYGVEQAGRTKGRVRPATQEKRLEVLRRATEAGITMPTISAPVTSEDRRTITPPKDTEAAKAARELERFIERRQRFEQSQADAIRSRLEAQFKESQELQNQETLIRAKLAGNEEEVRYAIELGQLQEKYGDDEGRRLADQQARIRESTKALEEQQRVQQTINDLVNSAGQQFTGLFETLINGTNDFNSALRNVLTSLSSMLFRYGLSALGGTDGIGLFSILSGTFTGGKPRALGGPVSSGQPYMVGERGPEMFVPGAQGNIVPNNALGGSSNIVVNVDATGSNVEGNGNQANQLGKVIGLAVQQELVKQKRPGGLLAGT